MKNQMIDFAESVNSMFRDGKSLREISRWSYAEREAGAQTPYLAITDCNEANEPVRLNVSPTAKQPGLRAFFVEKAPGSAMSRFTLWVDADGAHFTERLGRGPEHLVRIV